MISFIIPFANTNDNLHNWKSPDSKMIILSTILAIKNINKTLSDLEYSYEIILVDNTNSFPNIEIPNLKIVKGLQYKKDIPKKYITKYKIDNLESQSMWASMAYNIGIENAKGDYIILQHNDIYYHTNMIPSLIEILERDSLGYISADYKKLTLSGYLGNKEKIDNIIDDIEVGYSDGGFVKTKRLGFSDCYFFLCKKEFFDNYYVDWDYGDSNHGATIKCLDEGIDFLHIGPYYDNPNFPTHNSKRTYTFKNKDFITHLKGGFSEHKLSFKNSDNTNHMDESNEFLNKLIQTL